MLTSLIPIYRQLEETYEAVRISIDIASPVGLSWRPSPVTRSFGEIVEHIASANLLYATIIGPLDVRRSFECSEPPSRDLLLASLNESLSAAEQAIANVSDMTLNISRSDDWCPNCEEQLVLGPLDAQWFAQQMVRHTAYHLGQLNLYLQLMV